MKKIDTKKLLKKFAIALLGAIIGYLLYYSVIMEVIVLFIESSGIKYTVISILALVISVAGCIATLSLIINRKVNKHLFFIICVAYFAILFATLFLRSSIERVFIFNPLTSFIDTFSNWEMALQSIMNLAVFIPMGYFVRKLKYSNLFIFSIVIPSVIELIQVATMRGFFDVFDILLYFIGINIGYFIFKKWQLIVE
jgi:glycopeptide antibiotics resistance protein